MESVLLTLKTAPGKKTWVAAINGKARKWGLDREFVGSFDGRQGERDYLLEDAQLYEVCELGERTFLIFDKGEGRVLSKKEVIDAIDQKEEERKKKSAELDQAVNNALVRFTGEGGFSLN